MVLFLTNFLQFSCSLWAEVTFEREKKKCWLIGLGKGDSFGSKLCSIFFPKHLLIYLRPTSSYQSSGLPSASLSPSGSILLWGVWNNLPRYCNPMLSFIVPEHLKVWQTHCRFQWSFQKQDPNRHVSVQKIYKSEKYFVQMTVNWWWFYYSHHCTWQQRGANKGRESLWF